MTLRGIVHCPLQIVHCPLNKEGLSVRSRVRGLVNGQWPTANGQWSIRCLCFGLFLVGSLCGPSPAADPCRSGLQPGQRPGPYAAVMATGPQRGQPYCLICETAGRPAVVVFARTLSDPLGKLVGGLDKALAEHKGSELRAWVTFVHADQPAFDPQVVQWGQKHAVRSVPLGVFEDAGGPPGYRLARDADVTVLLFARQKVVANFAYRSGELTEDKITEVLKALPEIVGEKK
jgi:hypothetical protein